VRVGVGCFVRKSRLSPNLVLVGVRKGSHGAGRLALPGGHLEMGESWEACATRELLEEANLAIEHVKLVKVTNDVAIDGNPDKHYITLFMEANVAEDSPPLTNMEPHKCESWRWMDVEELASLSERDLTGSVMFDPLRHFFENNGVNALLH